MKIRCDICKKKNKFHYMTASINGETVTYCDDCRNNPRNLKSQNQLFNELQIPFWKLMGQKPKKRDVKLEKFLKHKGWTYGDYRRYRDSREAKYKSALPEFQKHWKNYGRDNEPTPDFKKES